MFIFHCIGIDFFGNSVFVLWEALPAWANFASAFAHVISTYRTQGFRRCSNDVKHIKLHRCKNRQLCHSSPRSCRNFSCISLPQFIVWPWRVLVPFSVLRHPNIPSGLLNIEAAKGGWVVSNIFRCLKNQPLLIYEPFMNCVSPTLPLSPSRLEKTFRGWGVLSLWFGLGVSWFPSLYFGDSNTTLSQSTKACHVWYFHSQKNPYMKLEYKYYYEPGCKNGIWCHMYIPEC